IVPLEAEEAPGGDDVREVERKLDREERPAEPRHRARGAADGAGHREADADSVRRLEPEEDRGKIEDGRADADQVVASMEEAASTDEDLHLQRERAPGDEEDGGEEAVEEAGDPDHLGSLPPGCGGRGHLIGAHRRALRRVLLAALAPAAEEASVGGAVAVAV